MSKRSRIALVVLGSAVLLLGALGLWAALSDSVPSTFRPIDLSDMVFVSGGSFSVEGRNFECDSFWIDRFEVTELDWADFAAATTESGHLEFADDERRDPDYPVRYVAFDQAARFARWHFKRLPTNSEWERASQGPGGAPFPWGAGYSPAANIYEVWENRGFEGWGVTRVGTFERGKSAVGAYDMIGNVWEWTSSPFDEAIHPPLDPKSPEYGELQTARDVGAIHYVARGGAFTSRLRGAEPEIERNCRAEFAAWDVGFRCVVSDEEVRTQRAVARLLDDLGHRDPLTRFLREGRAESGLVDMGSRVRPYLERAEKACNLPWLKARYRDVIESLRD